VSDDDKTYLDWMEDLIHDFLSARQMRQLVFNKSQASRQIFATHSGFYNTPTNKEINGIIDLSWDNFSSS